MCFFRAAARNDSFQSSKEERTSTWTGVYSILPFSYLRKSRIWLTRRKRIFTFRWISINIRCWSPLSVWSANKCSTGSATNVSGVRKSWDIFVKKTSLACVASSSWWESWMSWSRCSSSLSRCSSNWSRCSSNLSRCSSSCFFCSESSLFRRFLARRDL